MSSACPSEDLLLRFISGDLDSRRAAVVQEHVRDCASCRELVHGTNRVFHAYQTYADDPAEQPRWEGFDAVLRDQHETLVRQRRANALTARRWLSMAATVLIMIAAGAVWYRYTEVPLNAEHVLSQAMAFERQSDQGIHGDQGGRRAAAVSFRRVKHAATAGDVTAPRKIGSEPERVEVARELSRRLAPYGFYASTALSARHYWNWRTAVEAGRRDDQLARVGEGLIKVSTSTPDGPVREAEITVRSSSYEPVAQTWRFADGFEATMERVTGEAELPIESVAADTGAGAVAAGEAASVVAGANALPPDFDLVEVEARAALQRLGVPVDASWVVRRAGARVRISGAVASPALAEAVASYASGRAAAAVDLRVRVEGVGSVQSPIANAPGFQNWLEESYADQQSRARFVPMASDLVERWRVRVNVLAALSKRFPAEATARLSRQAREELDLLAAAQYRDVAAAHAAVTAHLAGLVPASPTASAAAAAPPPATGTAAATATAGTESASRLPEDWRARVAALESSVSKTSSGLATLFERADLMTADDVRSAANAALRPPLDACARALQE